MPTVISSSVEDTAAAIAAFASVIATGGAHSLGIHLEGPFLNPVRSGAHPMQHLRPPSLAEAPGLAQRHGYRDGHPRP